MWKVLFQSSGLRKDLARSRRRSFGPTSTKVTGDGRSLEVCSINLDNCVQKLADRQRKKRGCYNLRSEIWWPSRCFQQKEVIVWPRYKEFWLSCIWEISLMFLKHPRGLQIRMRSLKMVHFKIDNTPVLLLATWPCFCIMGHVPWFFNGQCVVIHWFLHR